MGRILDLPCVLTTGALTPNKTAPPYLAVSNLFFKAVNPGLASKAPTFGRKPLLRVNL